MPFKRASPTHKRVARYFSHPGSKYIRIIIQWSSISLIVNSALKIPNWAEQMSDDLSTVFPLTRKNCISVFAILHLRVSALPKNPPPAYIFLWVKMTPKDLVDAKSFLSKFFSAANLSRFWRDLFSSLMQSQDGGSKQHEAWSLQTCTHSCPCPACVAYYFLCQICF